MAEYKLPTGLDALGLIGADDLSNQNNPFFESMRRILRQQLAGQQQASQRSALNSLESRGLGQSSVVGTTLAGIAGATQENLASGLVGIEGQRAQFRQQLIRDALDWRRSRANMKLQKELGKKGFFEQALGTIGQGLGTVLGSGVL